MNNLTDIYGPDVDITKPPYNQPPAETPYYGQYKEISTDEFKQLSPEQQDEHLRILKAQTYMQTKLLDSMNKIKDLGNRMSNY